LEKLGARVWDADTGAILAPMIQHEDGVIMARFSPEGDRIVTASEDGTAGIWDAGTGRLMAPFLRHSYQVYHAVFSPDGRFVATASRDMTARVWDARTGEPVTPPLRHQEKVYEVVFNHDATRLATVSGDGRAYLWNLDSDQRPIEVLVPLIQLLNSRQIDSSGAVLPIAPERLREIWRQQQGDSPLKPTDSESNRRTWHEAEATDCESHRQWFAAIHHLEHLLKLTPSQSALHDRLARAKAALARQSSTDTARDRNPASTPRAQPAPRTN
jgi:WD40 repeat protein